MNYCYSHIFEISMIILFIIQIKGYITNISNSYLKTWLIMTCCIIILYFGSMFFVNFVKNQKQKSTKIQ